MKFVCRNVSSMPGYNIKDGEQKSTNDKTICTQNKELTKAVVYCAKVNSYAIVDGRDNNYSKLRCAAFDSAKELKTYKCAGVRGYDQNRPEYNYLRNSENQYVKYTGQEQEQELKKTLVKNPDINKLREYLEREINSRKGHHDYRSFNSNPSIPADVKSQDLIDSPQQTDLREILTQLKTAINNIKDYKSSDATLTNSRGVASGDMVEATDLRVVETDLLNTGIDCICYSDCTEFLMKVKRSCTCNLNCNCNYT